MPTPTKKARQLTYRAAGVDIDKGDEFVTLIGPLAQSTKRPEVLEGLGGFGALFSLPKGYRHPVLVSGTDGVGTKLKLAFELKKHDTIGVDLVAMCANDIAVQGAEPLFFLDYFATGKLSPRQGAQVVKGIAKGCQQAGCALIGGETAEMPGFYAAGEYDLAGFCVGVAERSKLLPTKTMKAGDVIIGLGSTGVHSNGYSLVRRILKDRRTPLGRKIPGSKKSLGALLLEPTRIYVPVARELQKKTSVKGFAHITGGGLPGNLPRVIPPTLRPVLDRESWPHTPLFEFLQQQGRIGDEEMLRTFNCGVGFCAIFPENETNTALGVIKRHRIPAWVIGVVERRRKGQSDFEILW